MARRLSAVMFVLLALPLLVGAQPPAPSAPPAQPEMTDSTKLERAQTLFDQGTAQQDEQLLQQALDLVTDVLQRDQQDIQANVLAGEILVAANQYDQARNHFKTVLDREDLNFRANLGYGKILAANHLWRQSAAYLEKAENVAAGAERIVDVKTALAFTYAGMGDLLRAIDKAGEAVNADPTDLDALQTLVEIRVNAATRLAAQLEAALQATKTYAQKAAEAAQAAPSDRAALARLEAAYNLQMTAIQEFHNSFYQRNVHNQPTNVLLPGKNVEAAAALSLMVEVMSQQADLRRILADHDALLVAEKAVEYDPTNVKYLETLATLYHRTSNLKKAEETCRRILELEPDHAGAKQYLKKVGPADASSAPAQGDDVTP